jgi:RNA polymerase sigma-70 factor (ECF subfamily)
MAAIPSSQRLALLSTQTTAHNGDPLRYAKWVDLVGRVRHGDAHATTELYRLFSESVRYSAYRHLSSDDLDDMLHDAFIIVLEAVRRGRLREPERLMGFVKTVVRRQVATYIDAIVRGRAQRVPLDPSAPLATDDVNPEQAAVRRQRQELVEFALQSISTRDREILIRFYRLEQDQERICLEMGLTRTQFRLLKSRAKARFGEVGRQSMVRHHR